MNETKPAIANGGTWSWVITICLVLVFFNSIGVYSHLASWLHGRGKSNVYKYQVTGSSSSIFIDYVNAEGDQAQLSDVSLPWVFSFKPNGTNVLYLAAQNRSASGDVTVTIYRDGVVMKTTTSHGGYVTATASVNL